MIVTAGNDSVRWSTMIVVVDNDGVRVEHHLSVQWTTMVVVAYVQ